MTNYYYLYGIIQFLFGKLKRVHTILHHRLRIFVNAFRSTEWQWKGMNNCERVRERQKSNNPSGKFLKRLHKFHLTKKSFITLECMIFLVQRLEPGSFFLLVFVFVSLIFESYIIYEIVWVCVCAHNTRSAYHWNGVLCFLVVKNVITKQNANSYFPLHTQMLNEMFAHLTQYTSTHHIHHT